MVSHDELSALLSGLIEVCKASERSYHRAAADLADCDLSAMFLFRHYAQQRAQFVSQLQTEMQMVGYQPFGVKPVASVVQPEWELLHMSPLSDDRLALFAACIRQEKLAEAQYATAMRCGLPERLYLIVKQQYMQIREARSRIRTMERALAMDAMPQQRQAV